MKKWLFALEQKAGKKGIKLTDEQVAALKVQKQDDHACGEIETHYSGYPGSQYMF